MYVLGMKYIKHLFKIIDWVVFIVLGVLALVSVEESVKAYSDGKTSWAIEIQPIQNQPTLSICFALSHNLASMPIPPLIYGNDFYINVTTSSKRYLKLFLVKTV